MNTPQEIEHFNRRLDRLGWALFLILTGAVTVAPNDQQIPVVAWVIGAGLIMLGINLVRLINRAPVSSLSIVIGTVALIIGLGLMLGRHLLLIPVVLIVGGVLVLYRTLIHKPIID
jgi:hypothetical protein